MYSFIRNCVNGTEVIKLEICNKDFASGARAVNEDDRDLFSTRWSRRDFFFLMWIFLSASKTTVGRIRKLPLYQSTLDEQTRATGVCIF